MPSLQELAAEIRGLLKKAKVQMVSAALSYVLKHSECPTGLRAFSCTATNTGLVATVA